MYVKQNIFFYITIKISRVIFIRNTKRMFKQIVILIFFTIYLSFSGCSEREEPPYFTASIVDVYKNKTTIENFKFLYWWEERGETPFLKPYTQHTKEIIVEVMVPFKDNPRRVTIKTERISLRQVDSVSMVLTEGGKNIEITLKDGKKIVASNRFPRALKRGEKTGLADFSIFAEGTTGEGKEKKPFKLELNRIKQIKIVKVDHQ